MGKVRDGKTGKRELIIQGMIEINELLKVRGQEWMGRRGRSKENGMKQEG